MVWCLPQIKQLGTMTVKIPTFLSDRPVNHDVLTPWQVHLLKRVIDGLSHSWLMVVLRIAIVGKKEMIDIVTSVSIGVKRFQFQVESLISAYPQNFGPGLAFFWSPISLEESVLMQFEIIAQCSTTKARVSRMIMTRKQLSSLTFVDSILTPFYRRPVRVSHWHVVPIFTIFV